MLMKNSKSALNALLPVDMVCQSLQFAGIGNARKVGGKNIYLRLIMDNESIGIENKSDGANQGGNGSGKSGGKPSKKGLNSLYKKSNFSCWS